MSAPVPDATGDQGGALDLDAHFDTYEAWAKQQTDDAGPLLMALFAEVRRLRAQAERVVEMAQETLAVDAPGFPADPAGYEEAHSLARATLDALEP